MKAMRSTLTYLHAFRSMKNKKKRWRSPWLKNNKKMMMTRVHVSHPSSWAAAKVRIESGGDYPRIRTTLHSRRMPSPSTRIEAILFQQGEYDGYPLGYPTQPCEKNSFEVTSCQIPTSVDLSPSPLFEFHKKRHFMEFFLNFQVPFLMRHIRALRIPKMIRKVAWDQGMLFSEQYSSKCVFIVLVAEPLGNLRSF